MTGDKWESPWDGPDVVIATVLEKEGEARNVRTSGEYEELMDDGWHPLDEGKEPENIMDSGDGGEDEATEMDRLVAKAAEMGLVLDKRFKIETMKEKIAAWKKEGE